MHDVLATNVASKRLAHPAHTVQHITLCAHAFTVSIAAIAASRPLLNATSCPNALWVPIHNQDWVIYLRLHAVPVM